MGDDKLTLDGITLRAWQRESLDDWISHQRKGVVEAVTGTGKTTLGLAAVVDGLNRGRKVLIVVPSVALLDQWYASLRRALPAVDVGRRGGGNKNDMHDVRVLITTVHSASSDQFLIPPGPLLLIADEVHRYGSESFSRILRTRFSERLGMTATFERSDDAVADMLLPYFENRSVGCDYERARREKIIAPVRVMTVPVSLSARDFGLYRSYGEILSKERWRLVNEFGCREEPFGTFMKDVEVAGKAGSPSAAFSARRYLHHFSERRAILAKSPAKLKLLTALGAVLVNGGRTIVFSETIESAQAAGDALTSAGVLADTMTSALSHDERRARLKKFEFGAITALAAPKLLDEGIDVAEADVGIIVAASSSKRQMIQRIGRIIRPKPDGRAATFVILYAQGTVEDPAQGAHESFLEILTANADEQLDVPPSDAVEQLARWLNQSSEQVEAARTMPRVHALSAIVRGGDVFDPVRDGTAARLLSDPSIDHDVETFDAILACLSTLTRTQVQVLATRYGFGGRERASVREASRQLALAPRDVVRLEDEALGRLENQDVAPLIDAVAANR